MAQFAMGCEGVRRLRGQHALSPIGRIPYVTPVTGLAWGGIPRADHALLLSTLIC